MTNKSGAASFSLAQEIASGFYPALKPLSTKTTKKDTRSDLTNMHLDFFRSLNSDDVQKTVHSNFPFSYYSNRLKSSLSEIQSLEFIDEEDVKGQGINVFNVDIHTLRYYKLASKRTLYTTIYLDHEDKVVFFDYPESS